MSDQIAWEIMADPNPLRLEVQSLSRAFGGRMVVCDVSLQVAAGQGTCLLGPSGCGKSTTLRMIAGVETPETGRILIDGQEVFGPHVNLPPEARGVGLMFQDFALFPHLTVAGNVSFGLTGDKAARARRGGELLGKGKLPRLSAPPPPAVSGGGQPTPA